MTFVVFSLPRSRSAWLSVFLSTPDAPVGHDIGPTVDSVAEFMARLGQLRGTCETGAAFAWALIRKLSPQTRFAVIRRDPADVLASLARFGFGDVSEELNHRASQLSEISSQPGTMTVDFEDLQRENICAELYHFCVGKPMRTAWWSALDPLNIQVDMNNQIDMLVRRREQIEALKAEAAAHV